MTNSADVIIQFFTHDTWMDRVQTDVYSVFYALEDIRRTLTTWETAGQKVGMYVDALPRWRQAVASNLNNEGIWITGDTGPADPTPGDMGLLQTLSEKLDSVSQSYDSDSREKVAQLVEEVSKVLRDDHSLPESLRWHIAKVLLHVKACIDEYAIRGDVDLEAAVSSLIGAMRLAEEASQDKSAWAKVWEKYGTPIVVGLFVELVGGGGVTAILAVTSGS